MKRYLNWALWAAALYFVLVIATIYLDNSRFLNEMQILDNNPSLSATAKTFNNANAVKHFVTKFINDHLTNTDNDHIYLNSVEVVATKEETYISIFYEVHRNLMRGTYIYMNFVKDMVVS